MSLLTLSSINFSKPLFKMFGFMVVPWTLFNRGPGIGIPGFLQLGFILLMIAAGLWRFRSVKAPISMRAQLVLLAYLAATLISNVVALFFIPHLLD